MHALGLRTGIAFPQLIAAPDGRVIVVECAARIPGGQMADLVRLAVGVDLVEVQLRMALGEELPDELVQPQFKQPLAIRFLTAEPGPLPTGRVKRIGPLDKVLAFPGVVQADVYLQVGETIRPVRLDGDRRGYVIATADTNLEALDRAEAAARPARRGGRMSDPRTALVGAGYDAMADTWEDVVGVDHRRPAPRLAAAAARAAARRARDVVELGCGNGTAETRELARRFQPDRRRPLGGAAAPRPRARARARRSSTAT